MPARNTLVQLLALYTNPKSHSAQRHGQTDRETTYDGNTALCTKVHRAVKIIKGDITHQHIDTYCFSLMLRYVCCMRERETCWFV